MSVLDQFLINWFISSLCIVFSCFFVCLMIFHWMAYVVSFIWLVDRYSCILMNILELCSCLYLCHLKTVWSFWILFLRLFHWNQHNAQSRANYPPLYQAQLCLHLLCDSPASGIYFVCQGIPSTPLSFSLSLIFFFLVLFLVISNHLAPSGVRFTSFLQWDYEALLGFHLPNPQPSFSLKAVSWSSSVFLPCFLPLRNHHPSLPNVQCLPNCFIYSCQLFGYFIARENLVSIILLFG